MDDNFPNDIPVGFLGFFSGTDYAQACCFCGDMDFDVLEVFLCGINFLVFYLEVDLEECTHFCTEKSIQYARFGINK